MFRGRFFVDTVYITYPKPILQRVMIPSQFASRFPLCCVGYAFHHTFFRWCFAGHTFHGAFHNVFRNAFRYVKLRYVRDGSVLRCIMLLRNVMWVTVSGWRRGWRCGLRYLGDDMWVTVAMCGWRNVADGMWVTTWVTLCDLWCDGDDVRITLRGKHYVADAVEMTLRGWWCVSIHTGVKTQFKSK